MVYSVANDLAEMLRRISVLPSLRPGAGQATAASQIEEASEPESDTEIRERHIARPGDTLQVKGTDGQTWDIWEVLQSSTSSISDVLCRSTRTGTTLRIPASIFALKKFSVGARPLAVEKVDEYFRVKPDPDGTFTIENVPILACEARGNKLYSETELDRMVRMYWSDRQAVVDRYGPQAERFAYEPTIIIGHTSDEPTEKNQQRESVGTISALWRNGETLMSNWSGLSAEWLERLRSGALPNRSCEVKVKAGRIVSVALLSEEPYFHLPQMRRFSSGESAGSEDELVLYHEWLWKGNDSMSNVIPQLANLVKQMLQLLEQGAAAGAASAGAPAGGGAPGGGAGGGAPPPKPPGGPPTTFASGGKVSDPEHKSGTEDTAIGDKGKADSGVDAQGRATSSQSSQTSSPGDKPSMDIHVKLAAMAEDNKRLAAIIEEQKGIISGLGEKVKFAVSHIDGLTKEKREVSFRKRLEDLQRLGAPLGGEAGIKRHLTVLDRLSDEDAEAHFKAVDELPKVSVRHSNRTPVSRGAGTVVEDSMRRFAAQYNDNPDRYANLGVSADVFAASMLLGDLMGGEGDDLGENEEV